MFKDQARRALANAARHGLDERSYVLQGGILYGWLGTRGKFDISALWTVSSSAIREVVGDGADGPSTKDQRATCAPQKKAARCDNAGDVGVWILRAEKVYARVAKIALSKGRNGDQARTALAEASPYGLELVSHIRTGDSVFGWTGVPGAFHVADLWRGAKNARGGVRTGAGRKAVEPRTGELRVTTIHGLCNRILTQHRHRTELGNNFETLDELTQLLFIFEHFTEIIGPKENDLYLGKWKTKWTAIEGARGHFDKMNV